jgi:SAM-dependent methyltransferase
MQTRLYGVLDHPWVYRLARSVFAPGAAAATTRNIERLLSQLPPAKLLLDVGCGPSSRLFRVGLRPVGVDLSWPYVLEYTRQGAGAVVASAEALPFPVHSFDGVWSIGLLHHLPNSVAAAVIREMTRVCKSGGYVVMLDAVLPRSTWRRPLATLIRRLDRGKFMRSQREFESLLPVRDRWCVQRCTYTATGMEMLICWFVKGGERDQ